MTFPRLKKRPPSIFTLPANKNAFFTHKTHTRGGFLALPKQELLRKNSSLIRYRVNPSASIPQELGELYGYLSGALIGAYQSFNTLERLYMDADVVALLNRTGAPEFFVLLQELLVDNIILCIAKLTDKPESGRKPPQER